MNNILWALAFTAASIQVSNLNITDIQKDQMTLTWSNGSGSRTVILAHSGAPVDSNPVNGTDYTANAAFGSGDQIGTGNYVVYSGTGTTVTVTGLSNNTKIYFQAYTSKGSGSNSVYLINTKDVTSSTANDKTFTSDFSAVITKANALTYTVPALRNTGGIQGQVDIDYWITKRQDGSSWSTQDVVYNFRYGSTSMANFATLNYKAPSSNQILLVNSPTYTTLGFTLNGTNSYLNTQFAPNAGTNVTLNDAGAIITITSGTEQLNSNDFGAAAAGSAPYFGLQARKTSNNQLYGLNQTATNTGTNSGSMVGTWQLKRTASNAIALFKNGTSFDSDANASTSLPSVSTYIGCSNLNGTATAFTDRNYSQFEMGASQTGKEARIRQHWVDYSLGAELDSADNIYVSGNYAYVTATHNDALSIFDISDPARPKFISTIKDGVGGAALNGAIGIYVSGNYAYVTALYSDALEIVDISNKYYPVHAGKIITGTGGAALVNPWNVIVSGNYAYVVASGSFEVVDVSTPTAPTHAGKLLNGTPLLHIPLEVQISGNYAFIVDHQASGGGLEIIDISTPSSPTHAGKLVDGTGGALLSNAHGLQIVGNYAFVASRSSSALEVVDITTKSSPVHYASLTNGTGGASLVGPTDIWVVGNYAYISDYDGAALEIVDITVPSSPVHYSKLTNGTGGASLNTPDMPMTVGNYCYITDRTSYALEIVNISNPRKPVHTGKILSGY